MPAARAVFHQQPSEDDLAGPAGSAPRGPALASSEALREAGDAAAAGLSSADSRTLGDRDVVSPTADADATTPRPESGAVVEAVQSGEVAQTATVAGGDGGEVATAGEDTTAAGDTTTAPLALDNIDAELAADAAAFQIDAGGPAEPDLLPAASGSEAAELALLGRPDGPPPRLQASAEDFEDEDFDAAFEGDQ